MNIQANRVENKYLSYLFITYLEVLNQLLLWSEIVQNVLKLTQNECQDFTLTLFENRMYITRTLLKVSSVLWTT